MCASTRSAIIGPNGAGKSSMLNVINGVYTPQQGGISFRGERFSRMNPRRAAEMGIARTFQNLALFKGMSVLDNIMTGRNLRMKCGLLSQAFRLGRAEREEIQHREFVENIIDFLEIRPFARRRWAACPTACKSAWTWAARWRWSRACCCWTNRWPA